MLIHQNHPKIISPKNIFPPPSHPPGASHLPMSPWPLFKLLTSGMSLVLISVAPARGKGWGSKLEVPKFLQDFVDDINTANTAIFVEAGPIQAFLEFKQIGVRNGQKTCQVGCTKTQVSRCHPAPLISAVEVLGPVVLRWMRMSQSPLQLPPCGSGR